MKRAEPKASCPESKIHQGTPPTCPKVVVGSVLEFALLQPDLPTQNLHLRFSQLVVFFRPPTHSFVSCFAVPITIFVEWQPEEQNVSTKNWNWLWQTWRPFAKSHWSPVWIKFVAPLKTIWPNSLAGTMLDQAGVSLHAKSCTIELVFPFQHLVVNRKCGTANSSVNKADFNHCFKLGNFHWVNTIHDVFFFEGPSDQRLSTKCHRNLSKLDCKLSSEDAPLTSKTAQLSNSILPQTVQLRLSSKTVQLTA